MKAGLQQEFLVLLIILAAASLVFWETRHYGEFTGGQISPGAFPRLAAGMMGVFAVLRGSLLIAGMARLRVEEHLPFSRDILARPVAVAAAMSAYVFLFGTIPFFPLTLLFLVVVFFIFGVRPWPRLLWRAGLVSAVLYVLFSQILHIAA